MKRIHLGLIASGIIVMLALTFGANAAPEDGLNYSYQNGKVVLETGNVTLTVHTLSHEPIFQYQTETGLQYTVIFKQIIEYVDTNSDGAFQYNETVPSIPVLSLTSVNWDFSGFQVDEVDGVATAVHFNFTVERVNGVFYKDLDMTIAAHFYMTDQEVEGYTVEGGYELKFDIIINQFPWMAEDTNLVIRFDMMPSKFASMHDPQGHNVDPNTNTTMNEKRIQHQNQVKNMFNFTYEGETGYFAYANQSQVRNQTEQQYRIAPVNASYSTDGKGDVRIFLSFEHANDIIYDPSIGATVEESSSETPEDNTTATPIGITMAVIALLGTAALLTVKRK